MVDRKRATGIGVTVVAVAFLGIAGVLGWAIFTQAPRPAGLGSSNEPSASIAASPSADATLTAGPTSTPALTPGFEAPAGILPPQSRAVVTLDGLRIRDSPGLKGVVLDTLTAGTVVEVDGSWGPIVVDGIDWYWIEKEVGLAGYAAIGSDGDRYLDPLPPRCEDGAPDIGALVGMMGWERLACFGDRSLTLTGTYGCPVCGAYLPGTYEPSWLASPENLNYLSIGGVSAPSLYSLTLHFPPEAGFDVGPNGSIVRVTGHFSDPASTTCVIEPPGQQGVPVSPASAELWCREQFVVEAYEIIGTDPDFASTPGP